MTERALATEKPCQLHKYHAPKVVRTQGHHRHPVSLQNEVYGRIRDPQLIWLCGTSHDSIHAWIDWLLGRARKPSPEPGRHEKREAEATVAWYREALTRRS